MTKKPLKQYIQKLADYNNNRRHDVSTTFTHIQSFSFKHLLIKRTKHVSLYHEYKFYKNIKQVFNRYMNNSEWHW